MKKKNKSFKTFFRPIALVDEEKSENSDSLQKAVLNNEKFLKWFNDSKAVDKEGKPMVMFHGTRSNKHFTVFSVEGVQHLSDDDAEEEFDEGSGAEPNAFMGAHFAQEPHVASMFARGDVDWLKNRYQGREKTGGGRVYPVFLRITNPVVFNSEMKLDDFVYSQDVDSDYVENALYNKFEDEESDFDLLVDKYENGDDEFRQEINRYAMNLAYNMEDPEGRINHAVEFARDLAVSAKENLIKSGYDGVKYKNSVEGGISWIAFYPNQIKSVFSKEFIDDPDIMKEGSRGLKRQLRKKVSHGKKVIDKEKMTGKEIEKSFKNAFKIAQEMNKTYNGEVPVYHMIHPYRIKDADKNYELEDVFKFLFSGSPREISVSVEKGVWDVRNSIVLEGVGKLTSYFSTDVYTTIDEYGNKVPLEPYRDESSHDWDEGTIRLSDIEWESVYVPEDLPEVSWYNKILELSKEYEIDYKHMEEANFGALSSTQGYEKDIQNVMEDISHKIGFAREKWHELDQKLVKLEKELGKEDFFKIFDDEYNALSNLYDETSYDLAEVIPERIVQSQEEHLNELETILQEYNKLEDTLNKIEESIEEKEEQIETELVEMEIDPLKRFNDYYKLRKVEKSNRIRKDKKNQKKNLKRNKSGHIDELA